MNVGDERSESPWMKELPAIDAMPLAADESCDVVVIGSGIAGLSTAYELSRLGRDVVVIDRGRIGSGMTARTTAHLATELDDFYAELIKVRGENEAKLLLRQPGRGRESDRGDLPGRSPAGGFPPARRLSDSDRGRARFRSAGRV